MTFLARLRRAVKAAASEGDERIDERLAPMISEIDVARGYRPPKNITRAKDVLEKFEQAALPLVTVTETGAHA